MSGAPCAWELWRGGELLNTALLAFVLPKGFPFKSPPSSPSTLHRQGTCTGCRDELDRALVILAAQGRLAELRARWWGRGSVCRDGAPAPPSVRISFIYSAPKNRRSVNLRPSSKSQEERAHWPFRSVLLLLHLLHYLRFAKWEGKLDVTLHQSLRVSDHVTLPLRGKQSLKASISTKPKLSGIGNIDTNHRSTL